MSKASLIVGNSNWAIKDSSLLGYNINDSNIYSPFPFDVTRASAATTVNKAGLIVTDEEILSGELITNGDFSNGSTDWAVNNSVGSSTSIANGVLNIVTNGAFTSVDQYSGLVVGKQYKITLDVIATNGAQLSNASGNTVYDTSTVGTKVFYLLSDNATFTLKRYTGGNVDVTIDNVSVIEVNRNNLARIDYSDSTKGVLLTEPQSTNLIKDSNVLNSIGGGVAELNSGISPDGTQNAVKVTFGTALNDAALIDISGSPAVANTIHTFSVYAKSLVGDGQFGVRIDTDTQSVVGNQSFTATNEWVRYSFQFTTDALSSTFASNSRMRKIGTPNNEILFYGLQMEKLSYATSIIPTYGSTVTRNQDQVTNGGEVSTFNNEEGVLFAEIATLSSEDLSERHINLSNNGTSYLRIQYGGTTNQIYCFVYINGIKVADIRELLDTINLNKVALRYSSSGYTVYINGVFIETDIFSGDFTSYPLVDLSFNSGGSTNFFGKTSQVQVFKKALTDAELIKLTTI